MPIANIFRTDKVVLGSSCTLQAVENVALNPGIQSLIERASGETVPNFIATDKTAAMATLSTTQLDVLLAACGVSGLVPSGNTDFYHKLATATGNVARATTSHHRIRCASVLVYWTRITLPNQGRATVDLTICPVYDGSNEPFVYAGGVALSGSIAASSLAYFQCGPVYMNNTQFAQIQEIVIESGAKEVPKYADGEHHPTFRLIEQLEPSITFKTNSALAFNSPGPAGLALDGSNGIVVYGRKISPDGSRVANATTEHLKLTGLQGRAILVDDRGNQTEDVTDTIKVELRDANDTINILTIDTAAAIP